VPGPFVEAGYEADLVSGLRLTLEGEPVHRDLLLGDVEQSDGLPFDGECCEARY
jgi:hypothetical protein